MAEYVEIKGYRVDSRDFRPVKQSKELDYLLPKKGTQEALDALQNAVDEDNRREEPQRNCYGKPELYSNYDDPKNLNGIPTDEEASLLCAGCPLFKVCGDYGEIARPAFGIFGGVRYGDSLIFDDEE